MSSVAAAPAPVRPSFVKKQICFCIGLAVVVVACQLPPMFGMKLAAIRTLGVMIATVFWWVSEAMPIPVTGLLVLPLLHLVKAAPFAKVSSQSFGDPFFPFMIGCLVLSVAFMDSGLGKRITYIILSFSGTKVKSILTAYFWVPFVISAFITDLAVTALMYPIALGLAKAAGAQPGKSNLGKLLMFAISFGSVIGGLCTPSGVASNIVTMSFLAKNANLSLGFLHWTVIATPIAIVIGIAYQLIIKRLFPPEMDELPFGPEFVKKELAAMGKWSSHEKSTLVVFLVAVVLWMTSDFTKLPVAVGALIIVVLTVLPGFSAVKGWRQIEKNLEWGSLMLMVGGFALGVAAFDSGLAAWIAQNALKPFSGLPHYMQPFIVTMLVAVDSLGFASFTAAASVNVPLAIAYAQQAGLPIASMAMTAGLAASTHFILVTESLCFVLTYASGYFSFKDMAKIGIILTIISAVVISVGMVVSGMPMGTPIPR